MKSIHANTIITALGIFLGIQIGYESLFATEIAVAMMGILTSQIGLYVWEKRGERKLRSKNVGATSSDIFASQFSLSLITILISFGIILGIVRVQLVEEKFAYVCETTCEFSGRIISTPEIKDEYQQFILRPEILEKNILDILVRAPLYPERSVGEVINVHGKVLVPQNNYEHSDKKVFDYGSYLLTKRVGSEMFYPGILNISYPEKNFKEKLVLIKNIFVNDIERYVSTPSSSIATGMLFGVNNISSEVNKIFRIAGLSHIIVLSGFNIAIVISAILFIFMFLPLILRVIIAGASVVIFVLMVGGEASVIRATCMAFISLCALVIGKEYIARQALTLSLVAIVLYEPFSLAHDVSLHLSFLATAGIIYLSEDFKKLFSFINNKYFSEIFVTTFAAYVMTAPYIMYTFGTISTYSLLANIIVLPLVPIAMLIGFLVVVFAHVSTILATVLGVMDTVLIQSIIFVSKLISRIPFASIQYSSSLYFMIILYIVIFLAATYLHFYLKNETLRTKKQNDLSVLSDPISF